MILQDKEDIVMDKDIKAIIIDDEESGRNILINLLSRYCQNVFIVGIASNMDEGQELIMLKNPDLVFLDIEMPKRNGFDLLESLDEIRFQIIFTTAFSQYAIKAIRFAALDYLLKPIDYEDLQAAVSRFQQRTDHKNIINQFRQLTGLLRNPEDPSPRITISTLESMFFISVKDIIYCQGSGSYTIFHLKGMENIVASKNIKDYDDLLSAYGFFRAHQSFLVNLAEVVKYNKNEGVVILNNGASIDVAKRKKDKFLEALSKF
jgi:two-component system LytT family response regulator